jgi:protein disulfide-isomerase
MKPNTLTKECFMTKWFLMGVFLMTAALGMGQTSTWMQDFDKAQALAKKTNKVLLVDFSGTDWCPWCIKLDREVFNQRAFKEYARANLVLMLADFPQSKAQTDKQKMQNQKLSERFGVEGYPTVVLLGPDGKQIGSTGYQPGGAAAYVKHLKEIIAKSKQTSK